MRTWKTVAGSFLVGFLAGDCFGQEAAIQTLPISVDKSLINDLDVLEHPERRQSSRRLAAAMQTFLDVELDELRRVCNLNKGQLANLRTAAEAAVEASLEEWLDRPDNNTGTAKQPTADRNAASKQKLWSSAVSGILNSEQKKTLQQHREEAVLFYKSKNSQTAHLSLLDRELRFDTRQRVRLARFVTQSVKKIKSGSSHEIHLPKNLAKTVVAELTDAQQAKWNELVKEASDSALEIHIR